MRSRLLSLLLLSVVVACSAAVGDASLPASEAGPPAEPDAGNSQADAGLTPKAGAPSLVLVNGLVTGGTSKLEDVRVCLGASGFALPDDRPMPLSNLPGVPRGTGVDLGKSTPVTELSVFRAEDVNDAAWSDSRVDCSTLIAAGAGHVDHVTLSVSVTGPTLGVLVDDPTAPDGIALRTAVLPGPYDGTPETLQSVVADFSTLRGARQAQARLGSTTLPLDSATALPVTPYAWAVGGAFESATLSVDVIDGDRTVDTYAQTLGSIQYASDPTQAPEGFFDRRSLFVFVLVGQPSDRHVADDVRDAKFDGTGLHFAAVPYEVHP